VFHISSKPNVYKFLLCIIFTLSEINPINLIAKALINDQRRSGETSINKVKLKDNGSLEFIDRRKKKTDGNGPLTSLVLPIVG